MLPCLQAPKVETPGISSPSLAGHRTILPGICSCLAGPISQIFILKLRGCIGQNVGLSHNKPRYHAYGQQHGRQAFIECIYAAVHLFHLLCTFFISF